MTAIIGGTGSGKSTILNLILRFYDVTQGQVSVNGVDVRQLSPRSVSAPRFLCAAETNPFSGQSQTISATGSWTQRRRRSAMRPLWHRPMALSPRWKTAMHLP
ncbi:MAG: ATP-binding cassette domain-containing protein [Clostridia bacterium]